jgi:hypothetical protein
MAPEVALPLSKQPKLSTHKSSPKSQEVRVGNLRLPHKASQSVQPSGYTDLNTGSMGISGTNVLETQQGATALVPVSTGSVQSTQLRCNTQAPGQFRGYFTPRTRCAISGLMAQKSLELEVVEY